MSRARNQIDAQIGTRIRMLRLRRKLSQEQLGDKLGVTFQQIQKYEKGLNRISGSRLVRLCEVLDCKADQILGNGAVLTDSPDVLDVLKDKEMGRVLTEISRLSRHQRKAITTSVVMLIRAFKGRPVAPQDD